MPSKAEMSRRRSILFAAIGKVAAKEASRDDLDDGSRIRVFASIEGTVGRGVVQATVDGVLTTSESQTTTKSSSVPAEEVAAYLLGRMPERERIAAMEDAKKLRQKAKSLLTAADDRKIAAAWLKSLRSTTSETRRGAVSFELDAIE